MLTLVSKVFLTQTKRNKILTTFYFISNDINQRVIFRIQLLIILIRKLNTFSHNLRLTYFY